MFTKKPKRRRIERKTKIKVNKEAYDISWSSGSENDDKKVEKNSLTDRKWLNFKLTPDKQELESNHLNDLDQCSQKPSLLNENSSFCVSPLICGVHVNELSPLLSCNKFEDPFKTSPILAKSKHKRRLFKNTNLKPNLTNSPDLFSYVGTIETQRTCFEILNDSPTKSETDSFDIESVASQDIKVVESYATEFDDLSSYYNHKPKQKKYKKGTLSSQLQKSIHIQRMDTDIWKHEIYLHTFSDYTLSDADGTIKELIIKKTWIEFGKTMTFCIDVNDLNKFCIVLMNPTFVDLNKLKIDIIFKLYPKYTVQQIKYEASDIDCYLNISKILFIKQ